MSVTNSRKRSCVEKEHAPTREKTEKKEERDTNTSSSVEDTRDSPYVGMWDNIGEQEEMYLANTREEFYEIIMREKTFKKKVKEVSIEKLTDLCWTLHTYGMESIKELQILEEEDEKDANNRTNNRRNISLVSFQHRRAGWMAKELLGRLGKGERERTNMKARMKVLEKENALFRKQLEELFKERDELRIKLDSWKMGRKDASVSTESEVPEVVMEEEDTVPSTSIRGIPPNLVGALETIIEKKIEELLSRVGLPIEKEKKELLPLSSSGMVMESQGPKDGAAPTSKSKKLWSEVAATQSRKKPLLQKDLVPTREGKDRGGVHVPAVSVVERDPKPTGKRRGKKGNRRKEKWPKPPPNDGGRFDGAGRQGELVLRAFEESETGGLD